MNQTIALHPNFAFGYTRLGVAYRFKGMYDAALEALQKALSLADHPRRKLNVALVYATMGDETRARQILAEVVAADHSQSTRPYDGACPCCVR